MTRIRYTMPARSQGRLHMQRRAAELVGEDVRRRVFVCGVDSDVEALVREWLVQRLDDFHCDPQVVRIPRFTGPTRVGTHVVLNDARGSNPRGAAKAVVGATGLSPRLSVRGWTFRLNGVNDGEGV